MVSVFRNILQQQICRGSTDERSRATIVRPLAPLQVCMGVGVPGSRSPALISAPSAYVLLQYIAKNRYHRRSSSRAASVTTGSWREEAWSVTDVLTGSPGR